MMLCNNRRIVLFKPHFQSLPRIPGQSFRSCPCRMTTKKIKRHDGRLTCLLISSETNKKAYGSHRLPEKVANKTWNDYSIYSQFTHARPPSALISLRVFGFWFTFFAVSTIYHHVDGNVPQLLFEHNVVFMRRTAWLVWVALGMDFPRTLQWNESVLFRILFSIVK